jgi:ABC-type multidrug transport system ATPase subunit
MWSLIDLFKDGRCIVLTTHSMEEADALCARIGIVAYGRLRCLGSSLHLKNKFGEGYKVELTYTDIEKAEAFILSVAPGCRKVADFANVATFQLSTGSVALSELFSKMNARPESTGIVDWAVRQTSMEEVFLKISRESELEQLRDQEAARAITVTSKASAKEVSA